MDTKLTFSAGQRIAVLTGAGISAESGLKTFRDHDGLWEQHRVEDVATPEAYRRNPAMVWRFYKQRYFQLSDVKPNPAHQALVTLQKALGERFTLVTQNVDGLHTLAGNSGVLEMHGTLQKCFCDSCSQRFFMDAINLKPEVPICPACGGSLRPDIVWFGEMPYFLQEIDEAVQRADFFLVVGTSGAVYPAAQFVAIARMQGARTVGVNLAPPDNVQLLDEFHQGPSGKILPQLVKRWLTS